ncbi:MAG TPA: LysM domain-containing protein [Streptosporangiaceae bacterium]|nr:LysM domain-containing protein [Streptosporangiaceae bacterium]
MTIGPLDATPSAYPRTSRYYGIEQAVHVADDGQEIPYLRRRLLPRAGDLAVITEYEVRDGDRPDLVANQFLGDPEQWWRIADANPVLDPRELTDTAGKKIRITLPEGVPGAAR